MPSNMLNLSLPDLRLSTFITAALSLSPFVSQPSSTAYTDPTAPGTMALSPDFIVFIGDGSQLVPMLLDSAHPCTFLVGSKITCPGSSTCEPLVTFSSSNAAWLNLTNSTRTCQYASVGHQDPASVKGISADGYIGFAGWTPNVDNIVIADQFVSPAPLNNFLAGASGVLSLFGTAGQNCNVSAVSVNYWPDRVESDGTFLYMAPRRSIQNGPGLISWGNTPNSTVLGNNNYNLTNTIAQINITGKDPAARRESCAFVVPIDGFGMHVHDVGYVMSEPAMYIIATMSPFNIVDQSFAHNVAAAFQPSAKTDNDGMIQVECDAVPPKTLAEIGGIALEMNAMDTIVKADNGVCYSAFQLARQGEVLKLGQPFLRNVAMRVGWDLGLEFTSRPYYAA